VEHTRLDPIPWLQISTQVAEYMPLWSYCVVPWRKDLCDRSFWKYIWARYAPLQSKMKIYRVLKS